MLSLSCDSETYGPDPLNTVLPAEWRCEQPKQYGVEGVAMREVDVRTDDGRVLHAYDVGPAGAQTSWSSWHHGTPNKGAPPEPLFDAARSRGIRWIGYDRPSYGGSRPPSSRERRVRGR